MVNPSEIEVQWIVRESRAVDVLVTNSLGQTIYAETKNAASGLNTLRISSSNMRAGLYFIHIRSEGFSGTKRLIVLE
ncbi:MAG: T9SS type A sorting domain-containing protein [Cyclobacteriaceae bacterium]|nr:T9SS type A sorting domain-containing protein [Cyclobacteriaceae bacterium]